MYLMQPTAFSGATSVTDSPASSLRCLLTIRTEYNTLSLLLAMMMNLCVVFLVLRSTALIRRALGETSIYIIRKFFSIILMAIAVKIFSENLDALLHAAG